MNIKKKVCKCGIALACLALLPPALSVQAEEPANAPAVSKVPALEEVLVTATRRVESLQDVAMSVSAFSEQFLQDSGVTRLGELDEYTPNLRITTATDSRSTSIRIRGIGSVGSNSGVDPSVGLFIDEVYQGRSGMGVGDLVDVRQVEVLRGPQGTLYGKNTSAGAISILTNTPVENFESMGEVTYDSNQQLELRGMVNVPFGNSGHALRLTGFGVEGDHLYKNDFTGDGLNDANKWGGRARMLLDLQGSKGANDYGEFLITVDYTREDTDCCAFAVMDYNGLSTLNSPATNHPSAEWQAALGLNADGKPILAYTALEDSSGMKPPKADPFGDHYWFNSDLGNKVDVGGATVQWNRQLASHGALTFINAWRHYESDSAFDGDFTAYNAVEATTDVKLDQYSSELRLTSPGGETFDYLAGLYAYYSKFDSLGTFSQLPDLVNNVRIIGDLTLGDFFPGGSVNTDTNDYTTTSYAAFGQLVWNYSEKASATLGLRYTYEEKQREGSQITNPTTALDLPPIAGPDIYYDSSRNDSDLSPSLNLRYFFDPDIMGYGLVSRGFKSGGFNQRREVVGSDGEFDEEIATNYELGWKTSWGARRLQFNGTLFYVDYGDFQSQTFDGSSVRVTNAGNLESYGAELELLFAPATDLVVGTAIGYNKAEYGSFDNGQCTVEQAFYQYYYVQKAQTGSPGTSSNCTQDLKGKPLANAPEWNVSSYVQYDKDLGSDLVMMLRLEYSYIDDYFLEEDLDPNLRNNAVDIVNLRLGLASQDRRWEVTLWGRNMLDEEYYVFGLDIPTIGGYAGVVGPQATYGITLRLMN
ncbi:MAG: TonB-dependent receptor [Gammaproteobacteria bacterium]|nr:TonB-dependent receptor [Gammaproteobacteria bacterium]